MYCPECLAGNGGAHLLAWRVPFTFACTTHYCLLHAHCPRCGKPPQHGRGDGTLRPGFLTHVPLPGCCDNSVPLPGTRGGAGCASQPCGARLDLVPTLTMPDEWITLQQRLNTRLQPGASTPDQWRDLRALTAVILANGTLDDTDRLCGTLTLPETLADVWRTHTTDRETTRTIHRTTTSISGSHRTAGRQRFFTTTPENPALVAAAVAVGDLALAGDDDALWAIISTPVPDPAGTRIRGNGSSLIAGYNPTPELTARMSRTAAAHANTSRRNGFHQRTSQPTSIAGLADDGISPLLWADQYAARLEPLVAAANTAAAVEGRPAVPVNDTTLRRLASVALHKQLTAGTWHTSAEHFADQIARNRNVANATLDRLKKHTPGLADQYLTAISALASELEADPARLRAYPELRRAADVALGGPIPEAVYVGLGDGGRVTAQRRTYAAAWAWALIVDDHPWNAPAWGDTPPTDSDRETYRRWTLNDLPAVETALRTWARDAVTAQRGSAS